MYTRVHQRQNKSATFISRAGSFHQQNWEVPFTASRLHPDGKSPLNQESQYRREHISCSLERSTSREASFALGNQTGIPIVSRVAVAYRSVPCHLSPGLPWVFTWWAHSARTGARGRRHVGEKQRVPVRGSWTPEPGVSGESLGYRVLVLYLTR